VSLPFPYSGRAGQRENPEKVHSYRTRTRPATLVLVGTEFGTNREKREE
jgi:hypothetical protein